MTSEEINKLYGKAQKSEVTPSSVDFLESKADIPSISIDTTWEEVQDWREQRAYSKEPMPDQLWRKIFLLAKDHSEKKIRTIFSISKERYQKKYQEFHSTTEQTTPNPSQQESSKAKTTQHNFCEVNIKKAAFEPLKLPTNTAIVELKRPDGYVMKIHCLTDRFPEIFNAFYSGRLHATDNTQT